ncbi:MAG: flagellar biosynthesis protein FlhA [Spirochaetales bacterium]|uniref:Flagellar biosynthesis protein FlhA n=1 Tax=Candidatus Thalassospirochaeta sargassi TaxID=3119039 RepID=A0AAJ1MP17_9SPIO|nr:flagellar biosynthesis protein FlhA [Spirochaetales bacterium]
MSDNQNGTIIDRVLLSFKSGRTDIFVAIGVIAVIMMLLIPLPTVILDMLMSVNLVMSVMIILITLYTRRALDFSIFPTLLLVTTLFSLALNVSSTRLILSKGAQFDGRIVTGFATFVVGTTGSEGLVIGLIIFIVLIAVQFIVITKGATRVAEVAARFTLDSLPGKQMAIEAEYNSGAITEEEATRKKSDLQKEADFYGAMDGASKFVSGNVKIGILITVINIVGGLVVGMVIHGEPAGMALSTYITFAIGDGLVSQIPSLFISTATGFIVTRAISDGTFGEDVTTQFSAQGQIYWVGAGFLFLLGILPGFPWYVLFPLAILLVYIGFRLKRRSQKEKSFEAMESEAEQQAGTEPAEMAPIVPLDQLSIELGYGLIPLVDKDHGAELLDRITRIRRESALELGLVVPKIRIVDNMRLEPAEYCIKIKGVEVGKAVIRTGLYMAINPGHADDEIDGETTFDPTFGLPAKWITEDDRDRAERLGYTVVDSPSIIATHLTEIIKKHAHEMIGRQEVQKILDSLRSDYSAVVDEVTKAMSTGEIQKVLQGLLVEQVSIRNMIPILETLADYITITKDTTFLIEKVRQALSRQICLQYSDDDKVIRVLTIKPELEQIIGDSKIETANGVMAALEPNTHRRWITAVANSVRAVEQAGVFPIILCSEAVRALVRASVKRDFPSIVVLSVPEVVSNVNVETLGEISLEESNIEQEVNL